MTRRSSRCSLVKKSEQVKLATAIESMGFEAIGACSLCERQGRKCILSEEADSTRCAECVRQGKGHCDAGGPSSADWDALERQEEKIDEEEEMAMAKILRLRKMKARLRQRKREMIRRGLRTLDELEAEEEKERKQAEQDAQLLIPDELADTVAVGEAQFDLSSWLVQTSSFGTAPADGSNSQGSS